MIVSTATRLKTGSKMAEPNNPSTTPTPKAEELNSNAAALLDGLASANKELEGEDLDKFLQQQDPDFAKKVGAIAKDKNLKIAEITELDVEAAALFEETQKWANSKGLWKIIYRLMPFIPKLSIGIRKMFFKMGKMSRSAVLWIKNDLRDALIRIWKGSVGVAKKTAQETGEKIRVWRLDYRRWPAKLKLLLFLTQVVIILAFGGIYYAITGRIIPGEKDLFLTNFAEVATQEYDYVTGEEQELFYDNLRSMPNLFLLPKIVANIKASSNSGSNPMVAIELFAEGHTPEVMFEMKDREALMRDSAQRAIEDFSFDELESPLGKQKLTQVVSRELNRVLTRGQLKALRIKTIVLKP